MRRVGAVLVATLVTTLGAGGCDEGTSSRNVDRYVALGDSFTSGAGLPLTRRDAFSCGRSSLSYPHLVAQAIGAELVDASCGGATTENGTEPQSLGGESWPPQLSAVTKDTDLVTVGLGGNDLSWYLDADVQLHVGRRRGPDREPVRGAGHLCRVGPDRAATPDRCAAGGAAHRGAPQGAGSAGAAGRLPAAGAGPRHLPRAAAGHRRLPVRPGAVGGDGRRHARGGGRRGSDVRRVLGPSEGHDICAGADAWVNGFEARSGVAAAYHPLAGGQAAVAELVEQALSR